MTKREQYGLIFEKRDIKGIGIFYSAEQKIPGDDYSVLTYIDRLSVPEVEGFIEDLNISLNQGSNYDDGYSSNSIEDISIMYDYPNVNIEDILIISMVDMRDLLIEWLDFITNK